MQYILSLTEFLTDLMVYVYRIPANNLLIFNSCMRETNRTNLFIVVVRHLCRLIHDSLTKRHTRTNKRDDALQNQPLSLSK